MFNQTNFLIKNHWMSTKTSCLVSFNLTIDLIQKFDGVNILQPACFKKVNLHKQIAKQFGKDSLKTTDDGV